MKENVNISNQFEKLLLDVGLTTEKNYIVMFNMIKENKIIFPMLPDFYNKWKDNFKDSKVYNYKWKGQEFYIVNITDWLMNKEDAEIIEVK
jgi:hypothetical protein